MIKERVFTEFFGTATLLLGIVGSSFMADTLTQDGALALLINALVVAAVLAVIIRSGLNISGAHFNPTVTLTALFLGKIKGVETMFYLLAQILGGFSGVGLANLMFREILFSTSSISRSGNGELLGEIIATTGLLFIIFTAKKKYLWKLIPLWIFAAYFFTASTSFANPAVTIARLLTPSPAGISGDSIPGFIAAEMFGALLVITLLRYRRKVDL